MSTVIEISKDKVPYKFKVKFSNGVFQFCIRYNYNSDRFLMDLYSSDGTLIRDSVRIIFGFPIFWETQEDINGNLNPDYPDAYIIPSSDDGTEKVPNYENLSDSVFLKIQSRGINEVEFDYDLWDDNSV